MLVQGSYLDESAGLKKKEENLIIATATPKVKTTPTASWNKKVINSHSKLSSELTQALLSSEFTVLD